MRLRILNFMRGIFFNQYIGSNECMNKIFLILHILLVGALKVCFVFILLFCVIL